ncbi:ATP-binding protein [Ferrimonas sediminicola]|uniref:ATP-binding protein n=1 Tax=Ferrimonas sediminicola TaxID=2569538 RepID=A0A4U1BEE5_9GAMM|nr:ATP-binding protein [Ferrimonas sediminicola]TKB48339.1 ATP-binding protein [Ferrimonas sediminicola]
MSQEAFRLRRIIIIDSFWKGKVNEIDFDGHTQLEGTNGAGKTSLMRLLPLFYGMRPGDIVSKVDQAKNFANYYLPRESSKLVYEYQRPGLVEPQLCCMIASSDGRSVHYKLIDAPYRQEHFINADHKPFKMGEIERNYKRAHGAFCSNYLGVDKYRQVIQNLRGGRASAEVRQLQSRFSFGQVPMPHIDKVVNGTIEKNLDFEAVKKMLVAIAADYLARSRAGDSREQMQLNKDEIGRWLSDIQASREVHGVAEKIQRWQGQFSELEEFLGQLRHLLALCDEQRSELQDKLAALASEKASHRASIKELEQEFDALEGELKQSITADSDLVHARQVTIERLDDDKQKYDDDDAASYQLRADEKATFSQRLKEVNAIIESFEGDTAKVARKFEELLGKLDLELARGEGDKQQQMATIRQQAADQLAQVEQQYQANRRQMEQRLSQQGLELKDQQLQLRHALRINTNSRANPQLPAEISQGLQATAQSLGEAQGRHNELLRLISDERQHGAQLERQRDQQLHRLSGEQRRLDELKAQYQALEQQLHPAEGSLQAFLEQRGEAAGWKQNIGCLLSPELLARTDLAPQWKGEGSDTLYGVGLDLAPLQHNNPLARGEAEQQQRLETLEQQCRDQQGQIDQINELLKQLGRQLEQHQAQLGQLQQQERRANAEIDQLKQQQERQQQHAQEAVKQLTTRLDEERKQLSKQLEQLDHKLEQLEEQGEEELHELHNAALERRLILETDRDSQLETLSEQLESLQESVRERRRDYKKQQKQALDKIDPDGEVDKRMAERKELLAALDRCAEFEQKAREYQHFLSSQYNQREPLAAELLELQQRLSESRTRLEHARNQHEHQLTEHKAVLKRNKEQQERSDDLLARLVRVNAVCEPLGLEPARNDQLQNYQAEMLPGFIEQNHEGFSHLERKLTKEISHFSNVLRTKHGKSSLFDTWTQLVADNDRFEGCETVLKYRAPIGDLLQSAAQLAKSTGQLVIVNANMINEFYRHLENFDRRIKSVGRQLSERVTALAKFEALAEISVGTVTKLEQLEYWQPLRSFSDCFEQSRDQLREGSSEIPEELIRAMRELARVLPAEGLELEHNDLFDLEFVITEKGQVKRARNARQLKKVSSTGLSYLAMLSLFAGLLGMLRGDGELPSRVILPVDELGELAAENIELLLGMFDDNHIQMLSASPSTDRQVLALYRTHYKLKDSKIYSAHVPLSKLEQLLATRAGRTHATTEEAAQ